VTDDANPNKNVELMARTKLEGQGICDVGPGYADRKRALKHVTQPSSLMNSDMSTWQFVIAVAFKSGGWQIRDDIYLDHFKTTLDESSTCKRAAISHQNLAGAEKYLRNTPNIRAEERSARKTQQLGLQGMGRVCLGETYHVSAVGFIAWCWENIMERVVCIKEWQMADDLSIG
jgi:hypothetical protein